MPITQPKALVLALQSAIQNFQAKCGQSRAQLDVSGGIDSAVMLCLLAKAIGPDNVTAVYIDIQSSDKSKAQAQEVASVANVRLNLYDATDAFHDLYEGVINCLGRTTDTADDIPKRLRENPTIEGSIKSTMRAPIGRAFNRMSGGGIRYGTGNECEDRFLRFYQKGGDGEVDCNPLASLSKGEVFQLAHELGVPKSIQKATPSPDLWGNGEQHSDEAELFNLYGVKWTYSNIVDGKYFYTGTIERISRFLDEHYNFLFNDAVTSDDMDIIVEKYADDPSLQPLGDGCIGDFLRSARSIERATRHKANPNCSTLVTRKELLSAGLITNNLS